VASLQINSGSVGKCFWSIIKCKTIIPLYTDNRLNIEGISQSMLNIGYASSHQRWRLHTRDGSQDTFKAKRAQGQKPGLFEA